jgi:[protein-PII] uridylyltransferase
MSVDPQSIKQFLQTRHTEIADDHRRGAGAFVTCIALTAVMDQALRLAFMELPEIGRSEIAILALGGYGRGELCPQSDIDVMILCPNGTSNEPSSETAKIFLHLLWDAGVTVGHSVRSLDEALQVRGTIVDSWASMLESRFVCGNRDLADKFFAGLKGVISREFDSWFVDGALEEARSRHLRFGNSVKLLEPNVKKSAGGLRDLHTPLWLFRSTDSAYLLPARPSNTLTVDFVDILRLNGVIEAEEQQTVLVAYEFLLRARHAMHYCRSALHDTLEYALQLEVAEQLGYGPKDEMRSVEVFMHDYYIHARSIHKMYQRLTSLVRERQQGSVLHGEEGERIGDLFWLRSDVLSLDTNVSRFESAHSIFEAFVVSAENDAELDYRLRATVERSADLITPEVSSDPAIASLFCRILVSRRVAKTLGEMNELGVLGAYIPEFGELVAFFQHNVYHYFTADEHTLVALGNAERLRDQQGVLREVFRNLKRKDLLYVALLLHDIGKPKGVADHEVTGVDISRNVLSRIGLLELLPDVAFLVRNHLVMEQIAFRRNIHDPETIKEFAARFDRPERLDYLYLLTYADLSAVNVNVWTEWKASMLQDLYMRTSEVLRRNLKGDQINEFHQAKREATEVSVVDSLSESLPREKVERHLQGIQSAAYTAIFSEEDIAKHIEKSEARETVSALFSHSEGYTEITIIARDAPFALSKFCAVLAANDANIFDANIFTRDDGIIIDRFRVSDATTKGELEHRVSKKITDDLSSVMEGTLDIHHLFEAHHRRWKRRPKTPANPNVRVGVEFEDNPRYTIIDVYAPDSVGFLYKVTECISRLGVDIYFAKIATRVDGIVDAFYLLDRSGQPITDPGVRETMSNDIVTTVRNLQEQELT